MHLIKGEKKKLPKHVPQFLLDFSGYKHARRWSHIAFLKGGIHSSVWSTRTFLYNIREPRYKQIRFGHQNLKKFNMGQFSVFKYDVPYCLTCISAPKFDRNGFKFEACLRMSPLIWDMSQPFISRLPDIVQKSFCTLNGAMDPTFQMNYVLAFRQVFS